MRTQYRKKNVNKKCKTMRRLATTKKCRLKKQRSKVRRSQNNKNKRLARMVPMQYVVPQNIKRRRSPSTSSSEDSPSPGSAHTSPRRLEEATYRLSLPTKQGPSTIPRRKNLFLREKAKRDAELTRSPERIAREKAEKEAKDLEELMKLMQM